MRPTEDIVADIEATRRILALARRCEPTSSIRLLMRSERGDLERLVAELEEGAT